MSQDEQRAIDVSRAIKTALEAEYRRGYEAGLEAAAQLITDWGFPISAAIRALPRKG